MTRSLAELRAQKPSSLPTRVVKVCLDLDLLAEVQRLVEEQQDVQVEWQSRKGSDDEDAKPQRMAEGKPKRLAEIEFELEACWEKMRANEGELLLRAIPGGQWLRWKDDHPAREGNQSDEQLAFGLCNASDLADDLGKYVAAWNDEPLAPDDWSGWLANQIAPADLNEMIRTVISLHEVRVAVPKSRTVSPETATPATD